MRLYCPCLNVSVAVQESVTQHAPPPETLLHACRWPASPVACVRLARTLTASLTVAQPELCRHSTTPPHCTLVECLNCRTVVLAAPESDNPADVFVHPGLIVCSLSMTRTFIHTVTLFRSAQHRISKWWTRTRSSSTSGAPCTPRRPRAWCSRPRSACTSVRIHPNPSPRPVLPPVHHTQPVLQRSRHSSSTCRRTSSTSSTSCPPASRLSSPCPSHTACFHAHPTTHQQGVH